MTNSTDIVLEMNEGGLSAVRIYCDDKDPTAQFRSMRILDAVSPEIHQLEQAVRKAANE